MNFNELSAQILLAAICGFLGWLTMSVNELNQKMGLVLEKISVSQERLLDHENRLRSIERVLSSRLREPD